MRIVTRLATARLMLAESEVEKTQAAQWVTAWASAIGERQFSAIVEARFGSHRASAIDRTLVRAH